MVFEKRMQARWHDTDATLAVRPSMLLVYMQEAALGQLDGAGQNLDVLRARDGIAFILTRLSLRIYGPLTPGEDFTAATWVGEPRGFNYPRYYRIVTADGRIAAEAASDWALYELTAHRPLRAGEFSYAFAGDSPLPFSPRRNLLHPAVTEQVGERRIGYSDIDYNGHMNNTRYPDMVCDFLPGTAAGCRRIRQMELYFAREAPLGGTLKVFRGEEQTEDGTAYLVRTENAAGDTCLMAEVRCGQTQNQTEEKN